MKAWHFLRENRKLRYDDNRIVESGETYTAPEGDLVLCRHGMHGSKDLLDALDYAPGPIVCRVNITGEILEGGDKIVGRNREVLWMYDATTVLRNFACECALDVIHLWDAPEIVIRYLKTQDESIRDAARHAAWDAAECAARHAAWYAAECAARHAARYAAKHAAWYAAEYAAKHAAECVTRRKQERRLYRMILEGRTG